MKLSWKDAIDAVGFLLGLAIGVFLAFMPFLIDRHVITLRSSCIIAVAATLVALILFLVVKMAGRRAELALRKEERKRDEMLRQILKNQLDQMERADQMRQPGYADLTNAEMLYSYLLGEKPYGDLSDEQIDSMIRAAEGGPIEGTMHMYAGPQPPAKPEKVRYLADLLTSKALGY